MAAAGVVPPLLVLLGLAAPGATDLAGREAVVDALSRPEVRRELRKLSPERGAVRVAVADVPCGDGGTGSEVRFLPCEGERCGSEPVETMLLRCDEPDGAMRLARR